MSVDISTFGTYIPKQRKYELKFVFTATSTQRDEKLIEIPVGGINLVRT